MFQEKKSGLDGKREQLARCLEFIREGDTLMVTKVDRLARSTSHLYVTIKHLDDKGACFKVLDDDKLDTTTRTGKLLLGLLALIAEFEADIRKERQMEGIAKAKAAGVYVGRQKTLGEEKVLQLRQKRAEGVLIKEIMKEYGLSKASVYRYLGDRVGGS